MPSVPAGGIACPRSGGGGGRNNPRGGNGPPPQRSILFYLVSTRYDRPVLLGIVGDSASGKTTMSAGIAEVLGADEVTPIL